MNSTLRALIAILVVAFLLLGVVFGALNPERVGYDFLFVHFRVSKGVALLVALLTGWLLGGALCWAGSGLARRRRAARKGGGERT